MAGRWAKLLRGLALPALVCVSGCGGCGGCSRQPDAYPVEFTFPTRTDPIVLKFPTEAPTEQGPGGELDESIRRINQRGGKVGDPQTVPAPVRDELDQFLGQTFGTPAAPTIGGDEESQTLATGLGLTAENLAAGSRLFRVLCQDCHGATGNGRGPTGPWLVPHPRDYRQGAFKFTSTAGTGARKPSRTDLFRTLSSGLPPTGMKSYAMRSEDDRHRLIDYVMYLSLRGRAEYDVLKTVLEHGEDGLDGTPADHAVATLLRELKDWTKAQTDELKVTPREVAEGSPELAESIRRGHALFHDPKGAGCAACHVGHGRDARFQYDVWGTLLKPANLLEPKRKGGDDHAALFRRVRGGIAPSNMPAVVGLTDAQTWDVVHFLRAMPYPDRLPPDVKAKVYGE